MNANELYSRVLWPLNFHAAPVAAQIQTLTEPGFPSYEGPIFRETSAACLLNYEHCPSFTSWVRSAYGKADLRSVRWALYEGSVTARGGGMTEKETPVADDMEYVVWDRDNRQVVRGPHAKCLAFVAEANAANLCRGYRIMPSVVRSKKSSSTVDFADRYLNYAPLQTLEERFIDDNHNTIDREDLVQYAKARGTTSAEFLAPFPRPPVSKPVFVMVKLSSVLSIRFADGPFKNQTFDVTN